MSVHWNSTKDKWETNSGLNRATDDRVTTSATSSESIEYNLRLVLSLGTVALRMHIILYKYACEQSDELVPIARVINFSEDYDA